MTDFILINRAGGGRRVPRRAWEAVWARAQKQHPQLLAKKRLSLVFITAAEARRLNQLYRGKNKVANVLAFPGPMADEAGDIFICPASARSPAAQQALFVHALLHLAGYDHRTKRAEEKMNAAVAAILS